MQLVGHSWRRPPSRSRRCTLALTLADGVQADGWSGAWVRNPDVTDALRIGIDPWLGIVTLLPAISPS
jgi:hypothetical protein